MNEVAPWVAPIIYASPNEPEPQRVSRTADPAAYHRAWHEKNREYRNAYLAEKMREYRARKA